MAFLFIGIKIKRKPTIIFPNERRRIIKLEKKEMKQNMFHAQNVFNEINNISVYVEYR